ncbi:hypothetical protein [Phytohabitans houttuyneae]|uniref:Uncharacterized protein n=1 Tax=Phytohabitans houttuyneae TaxID=1076126 RepID=A0A6V8K141_9ACTN|nr:hypothetical protein [Phytohabitans houttuyneae]GFJ78813.1 hypothetical protein Phou_029930 [Phytohabitans houttuyneae]
MAGQRFNWATSWWRKVRREQGTLTEERHPRTAATDPAALAAREALARLPLAQRAVIVCRVLLDLSTAETADADLLCDRLVIAGVGPSACQVRVVGTRTRTFADHPLTRRGCEDAGSIKISPDGRLAAITYQRANAPRVAVIDLATGAPRADTQIQAPAGAGQPARGGPRNPAPGRAWFAGEPGEP